MKTTHAFALYVLGLCLDAIGALFKILHYAGGDEILTIATVLKVSGGLFFIYKIFTNPKIKEFLD